MYTVAIIPARMGSTRFPGKPLANIHGMPMIGHVYNRTNMSNSLDATYVATCDREINDYITSIGGKVIMTSDCHVRCTDRTAEAMQKIEQETGKTIDIVVMVQGDEPMVTPGMINSSIQPLLEDQLTNVTNLMEAIGTVDEFEDPNEVKVVVDMQGDALYFSREPVPSRKKGVSDVPMMKQVCIIPFRRDYLIKYNNLAETPLEMIESVDMMRILEHGGKVRMVFCEEMTKSVDTESDLNEVCQLMENDELMKQYV